jgi:ATP/maltotriose-dependent transcriptional regulator MalT
VVSGGWLRPAIGNDDPIAVGSATWFRWVESHQSFHFSGAAGRFTARKQQVRETAAYWQAYRKQGGVLRSAHLGRADTLSLERLEAAARRLAAVSPLTEDRQVRAGQRRAPVHLRRAPLHETGETSRAAPASLPVVASGWSPGLTLVEVQTTPREWPLTERESEVLRWVAEGYANTEIAECLVVSLSTVKTHLTTIYRKLKVARRTQAIARGRKLGLLDEAS